MYILCMVAVYFTYVIDKGSHDVGLRGFFSRLELELFTSNRKQTNSLV